MRRKNIYLVFLSLSLLQSRYIPVWQTLKCQFIFKEYFYKCNNRTYGFAYSSPVLRIEIVQSEPCFVKPQNLLCNGDKIPHNMEKVYVASYVSCIKHITFLPMSPAC